MATSVERKAKEQLEREQLLANNRAKFSNNRIVYVTPNGIHTAHDVEGGVRELVAQLKANGFETRATTARGKFTTTDWFKHGEDDFWESYVITEA